MFVCTSEDRCSSATVTPSKVKVILVVSTEFQRYFKQKLSRPLAAADVTAGWKRSITTHLLRQNGIAGTSKVVNDDNVVS